MKTYLVVALLIFFNCFFLSAQDKVKETSGKQPKWVNGLVKDYIISSGKGATSQEAQQKALAMVKEYIVSAVAENVKSSSTLNKEETNFNNKVFNFLEKFASQIATQTAKVPFLLYLRLKNIIGKGSKQVTGKSISTITSSIHFLMANFRDWFLSLN